MMNTKGQSSHSQVAEMKPLSSRTVGTLASSQSNSFPDLIMSDTSTIGSQYAMMSTPSVAYSRSGDSRRHMPADRNEKLEPADQEMEGSISIRSVFGLRDDLLTASGSPSATSSQAKTALSTSATEVHRNFIPQSENHSTPPPPPPPLPSAGTENRRLLLQRATSVPVMQSSPHDVGPDGFSHPSHSQSLTNYFEQHRSFLDSNQAEDSTIESSWRLAPEKRRILAETMAATSNGMMSPMISSIDESSVAHQHSLGGLLDAIISDSRTKSYRRDSPGINYRKRSSQRRKRTSSTQSVGSALDHVRSRGDEASRGNSQTRSVASGSMGSRGSKGGSSGGQRGATSQPSNNGQRGAPSQPIAWSRRESGGIRRGKRPTRSQSMMKGDSGDAHKKNPPGDDSQSSGILSTFLDRESRHKRPTSAHTVSGDPRDRSSDTVSIAISDGGGAKTFRVGANEARLLQRLLEVAKNVDGHEEMSPSALLKAAAAQIQSPPTPQRESVNLSGELQSPSARDATVASTINESDHISTMSSLMVELSPPLAKGKLDLVAYLDRRRRRDRRTSAFTVAGDRVSHRFKGKTTSELVALLQEEKESQYRETESKYPRARSLSDDLGAATAKGRSRLKATKSGAQHPRSDLEGLMVIPDPRQVDAMHQSMPMTFFMQAQQSESGLDAVPRAAHSERDHLRRSFNKGPQKQTSRNKKDVVQVLASDITSEGKRIGAAPILSNDLVRDTSKSPRSQNSKSAKALIRTLSPLAQSRKSVRSTSPRAMQRTRSRDLDEFRSPVSNRPTNRRTMMRKMHSVPILPVEPDSSESQRRSLSKSRRRSLSRDKSSEESSLQRSTSLRKGRKRVSDASDVASRSSRRSASRSRRKKGSQFPVQEKENDLGPEDLNRSFLDQFLDGEEQWNDSASQMQVENPEYKAALLESPIEKASHKLRLEPQILPGNRLIVQDPTKDKSSDLKRIKSLRSEDLSPALRELYDEPKKKALHLKKNAGKRESPRKKLSAKKKKKKTGKGKSGKPLEASKDPDEAVGTTSTPSTTSPEKVTLKDLPRQNPEGLDQSDYVNKVRSLASNDGRAYDAADRLHLMQRIKALSKDDGLIGDSENEVPKTPQSEKSLAKKKKDRTKTPPRKSNSKKLTTPQSDKSKLMNSGTSSGSKTIPEPSTRWSSSSPGGIALAQDSKNSGFEESVETGWTKAGVPRLPLTNSSRPSSPSAQSPSGRPSNDETEGSRHAPMKPIRKLSRRPDEVEQGDASPRKHQYRPGRLPPVAIAEGSILEVNDEISVCSDITDGFSWEPIEAEKRNKKKKKSLGRIDESTDDININDRSNTVSSSSDISGGNNGENGSASSVSRDRSMHLSKRWQSTPNIVPSRDVLTSPIRPQLEEVPEKETVTPGRFNWLKKKFTFKKKEKTNCNS